MALFQSLNEEFDSHQGLLPSSYKVGGSNSNLRHYDIRAFNGADLTVPRTMPDFKYWNAQHFNGTNMTTLDAPRSIEGYSVAARTMAELDAEWDAGELNAETLSEISLYTLASGGENWPTGDAAVVFGKDSTYKYSNTIRVTLVGGVDKTVTSTFNDNLVADFPVDGVSTYYIELALPDFPAQAAGSKLDLANSYIDFTSDAAYAAPKTDSFRFNQSLVSLTAGGDLFWRINRNSLVNVDLTKITGVRFRLRSIGNMTFIAQSLRMYQTGAGEFDFPAVGVETKRNTLKRSILQGGVDPAGVAVSGPLSMFNATRPKNVTQIARFNTGHLTANPAYIDIYSRYDPATTNTISAYIACTSTNTSLTIREKTNGATYTGLAAVSLGAALTTEKDYFLVYELKDTQVKLTVFNAIGAFFGTQVGTTGWFTTTRLGRGQVGYQLTVDNYDFSVDWLKNRQADFATYTSNSATSITPYAGATLYPKATPPQDLTAGSLVPSGDATVTLDGTKGDPAPSYKFVRTGASWFGGFQSTGFLFIGDPKHLVARGKIFPTVVANRTYRVLLIDKQDTVAWIAELENLQVNQWNEFEIPVRSNIAPANYRFVIQQVGFYNDTFWMQDIHFEHDTFAWSASPDGGVNWYNFYNIIGEQYQSVNFKSNPIADRTNLVVKAEALADNARIQGYRVDPLYEYPGHS